MTLKGFKKKLCEYFTFPDGTENEHIVIGRVIGGAGLKRKIPAGKMRKKLEPDSHNKSTKNTSPIFIFTCAINFTDAQYFAYERSLKGQHI